MKYKSNNLFKQNGQKLEFNFQLLDDQRVLMTGTFDAFTDQVKQQIKKHEGQYSNYEGDKGWAIPIHLYQNLIQQLRLMQIDVVIKQLPPLLQKLHQWKDDISWMEDGQFVTIKFDTQPKLENLDNNLNEKLYQYQRDCLIKGLELRGRILIADEMGVGKTVQSLALASFYQNCWPLLIMCPSALKLNWQDEIVMWLKIDRKDIQIINSGKDGIRLNAKVVIISYDLCSKLKDNIMNRKFQISIADECHYLKSAQAIRSQVCVPILKKSKHVILLTGTPALAKPKDLFNALNIIRPDIFSSFKEFGYRYCDPKLSRFSKGIDFDGATNLKELHHLLTKYIMIRRLKKDVLSQLPEKRRIRIRVSGETSEVRQIQALLHKLGHIDITQLMNKEIQFQNSIQDNQEPIGVQMILQKCYQLTGKAKLKAIKDYIATLFENDIKFLFFAHHLEVLDGVQEFCIEKKIQFIRIDGNVDNDQRHLNVRMFQQCDEIRVAILSITAASVGITLTASSTIVFGEMHWTPAIMLQAEDRVHRIGQVECVDCHYLIGDGTLDEHIYRKIEMKMNTVSGFIDGQQQNLGAFESTIEQALNNHNSKQTEKQLSSQNNTNTQLSEEDLVEILQILDTQNEENNNNLNLQSNNKQSTISSNIKTSSDNLKQIYLDKFLTHNKVKKEIIEDKHLINSQLQSVVQTSLNFGKGPEKLGIDYIKKRLSSDVHTKTTEQSNKKKLDLNFSDPKIIISQSQLSNSQK